MNRKTEGCTLEGPPGAPHASQALPVKMDLLIYPSEHVLASLEKKAPIYHLRR